MHRHHARRRTPQNVTLNEAEPYPVSVNVSVIDVSTDGVPTLLIQVEPEVLALNGEKDRKITWTLSADIPSQYGTGPFFASVEDVQFMTERGKNQFVDGVMDPLGKTITRTVFADETDQTIYTYLLKVRFRIGKPGQPPQEFAISIDPEVDNPPPAPKP